MTSAHGDLGFLTEAAPGSPGCPNPDCGMYPHYGVAPHECFYKKGPEFRIGQSTMLPRDQWPPNFVLDLEPGEDPETVAYPSACGTYFCPDCMAGHPSTEGPRPPLTARPGEGGPALTGDERNSGGSDE